MKQEVQYREAGYISMRKLVQILGPSNHSLLSCFCSDNFFWEIFPKPPASGLDTPLWGLPISVLTTKTESLRAKVQKSDSFNHSH